MDGHWAGNCINSERDHVFLAIDRRSDGHSGNAVFFSDDFSRQSVFKLILEKSADGINFHGRIDHSVSHRAPFFNHLLKHPPSGFSALPHAPLGPLHSGRIFKGPLELRVSARLTDPANITVDIYEGDATVATATLTRRPQKQIPTAVPLSSITWIEYKRQFQNASDGNLIFRGQAQGWELRTSFNRAQRFDLIRYAEEDIPRLSTVLSAELSLGRPIETRTGRDLIALLALAQHHGYPTPQLDWTRSAYIAAYFACCKTRFPGDSSITPTVFTFDNKLWRENERLHYGFTDMVPAISITAKLKVPNPRVTAQQAVFAHCNLDPFEFWPLLREEATKNIYLRGYSLSGDPIEILRDLRTMGISGGSMFPGLDGTCQDLLEESVLRA